MHIKRMQVDEGFLDGLDIDFAAGLNAIIGSRGTGKTSIIELIRFCLDVSNTTSETTRRSRDHALSILGSGEVTVTLIDNSKEILVSRTASDDFPRATSEFRKPVIFSQTEIENVGLEAAGRLRLLDGFVNAKNVSESEERDILVECKTLTRQIELIRKELDDLEQAQRALPTLNAELQDTVKAEQDVSKTSLDLQKKTDLLTRQSEEISRISVTLQQVAHLKDTVASWSHEVKKASDYTPPLDFSLDLAENIAPDLPDLSKRIISVKERLSSELSEVINIYHALDNILKNCTANKVAQENIARQLRVEVEGIQAGAGAVLRKGQELREKIAKLDSMATYLAQRKVLMQGLIDKRAAALDKLDEIRTARYQARYEAAESLNRLVGPSIRVSVFRNGQIKKFSAAISESLRGSGLRYAEIADALAENLSPRVLMEAVDYFDTDLIAETANISEDRASRLLSHLKGADLAEICTINIEDEVTLQLLDGTNYKDISDLSTGQRCTVVLPLILSHADRMLIVDQPEDHIDNAFVAKTLIKVILSRNGQGQIIFSTHNPNIPVLGNAEMVLHLGSDGRRGFRLSSGPLTEKSTVTAISTVMEGGAEAFEKRANFYNGSA